MDLCFSSQLSAESLASFLNILKYNSCIVWKQLYLEVQDLRLRRALEIARGRLDLIM